MRIQLLSLAVFLVVAVCWGVAEKPKGTEADSALIRIKRQPPSGFGQSKLNPYAPFKGQRQQKPAYAAGKKQKPVYNPHKQPFGPQQGFKQQVGSFKPKKQRPAGYGPAKQVYGQQKPGFGSAEFGGPGKISESYEESDYGVSGQGGYGGQQGYGGHALRGAGGGAGHGFYEENFEEAISGFEAQDAQIPLRQRKPSKIQKKKKQQQQRYPPSSYDAPSGPGSFGNAGHASQNVPAKAFASSPKAKPNYKENQFHLGYEEQPDEFDFLSNHFGGAKGVPAANGVQYFETPHTTHVPKKQKPYGGNFANQGQGNFQNQGYQQQFEASYEPQSGFNYQGQQGSNKGAFHPVRQPAKTQSYETADYTGPQSSQFNYDEGIPTKTYAEPSGHRFKGPPSTNYGIPSDEYSSFGPSDATYGGHPKKPHSKTTLTFDTPKQSVAYETHSTGIDTDDYGAPLTASYHKFKGKYGPGNDQSAPSYGQGHVAARPHKKINQFNSVAVSIRSPQTSYGPQYDEQQFTPQQYQSYSRNENNPYDGYGSPGYDSDHDSYDSYGEHSKSISVSTSYDTEPAGTNHYSQSFMTQVAGPVVRAEAQIGSPNIGTKKEDGLKPQTIAGTTA